MPGGGILRGMYPNPAIDDSYQTESLPDESMTSLGLSASCSMILFRKPQSLPSEGTTASCQMAAVWHVTWTASGKSISLFCLRGLSFSGLPVCVCQGGSKASTMPEKPTIRDSTALIGISDPCFSLFLRGPVGSRP